MLGKVEILIVIIALLLAFYFVISWGAGKGKKSPISKCLLDLWVDAPQYLLLGTFIFPKLSNSYLYFMFYNNNHKISETMAINIIKMRTPNKYLLISFEATEPFFFPAPHEITK